MKNINSGITTKIELSKDKEIVIRDYSENFIRYPRKEIEKHFKGKMPSIIEDLIHVALATFEADLSTIRYPKDNTDNNLEYYFSRNINLNVPVKNIQSWNDCKEILEEMISFLTYDSIKYTFHEKKEFDNENQIESNKSEFDSIILFSGGIDSLAGALNIDSKKPILLNINHCNIGKTTKKLFDKLVANFNDKIKRELITINIDSKACNREPTQFSRSFIFLCFATALAKAYDITKIYIPENGIIAIQILDKGRVGTRTVHPKFIDYYNKFINRLITNNQITIENPFMNKEKYLTKSDVVSIIKDKKMNNLIEDTISCSHFSSYQATKQCGMCIPCIYRTISIISNDIQDGQKNIIDSFEINLLNPKLEESLKKWNSNTKLKKRLKRIKKTKRYFQDAVGNILEVINLTYDLKYLKDEQLIIKYPELKEKKTFIMYQNFADEVIKTLEHYKITNPSLEDIYLQLIPEKP